ncbi:MAG: voltage-gated chloride channel family protein [Bdellovibrio sp.]
MNVLISTIKISFVISLLAGASCSLFLWLLSIVTEFRINWPFLIFCLPLFSLIQTYLNARFDAINISVPQILKSLNSEEREYNLKASLFILFSSLGTHLFGGSAGREGVGLIMASSLTDHFSNKNLNYSRHSILKASLAAGFSAMFATPLAGILFAFEMTKFEKRDIPLCALSSFGALFVTYILKAPHTKYFLAEINVSWNWILIVLIVGVSCGLGAMLFYYGLGTISFISNRIIKNRFLMAFLSTALVSFIALTFKQEQVLGIGIEEIQKSMTSSVSGTDWILKLVLTVLTIGVGLKGGEVTPLFFMGATLSNFLAQNLGLDHVSLWSALGFVTFFSAAASSPLTAGFIALELFSYKLFFPAILSSYLACFIMNKRSIYLSK